MSLVEIVPASFGSGTALRNAGLTVIGNRTAHAGGGGTNASGNGQYTSSSRIELVSPWTCYQPRFIYGNWYVNGTGEDAAPCDYWVGGSLMYQGASINEGSDLGSMITFGGKRKAIVCRGTWITSDPVNLFTISAGVRCFVKTGAVCAVPAAPSAPSVAVTAGTTGLGNATYYLYITYVYDNGGESLPSAYTSATTTAGNQVLTITSPAAVAGAIGYRVYMNSTGSASRFTESNLGIIPFAVATINLQGGPSGTLNNVGLVGYQGALSQLTQFGGCTLGGTGAGASNNGEGAIGGVDYSLYGTPISASRSTGVTFPLACLAVVPGGVMPSVAVIGDSIINSTNDAGYAYAFGGYAERAIAGQTSQYQYNINTVPLYGRISLSTSGETASTFAGSGGSIRSNLASLCTHAWVNYGTNDLGSGCAPIIANLITIHNRFLSQGMYTWQFCILPRASTTDYYTTLANQTTASGQEADRIPINNCIIDTTGQSIISGENMYRAGGSYAFGTNPYSGGNASTTKFTSANPFVQGSETITVGGVAKVWPTDYAYFGTATINGVACASGVTFTSAPGNGAAVVTTYTKSAGMGSILGAKYTGKALTVAAGVEYDTNGNIAFNGGYWIPTSTAGGQAAHTLTGVTVSSITDSSQTWTQDQWRGWEVVIVTDTTTPTAVGQINPILYNTPTVLTLANNFSVTPSAQATYAIVNTPTAGDVHPTSWVHLKLAQAIGLTSSSLVYP